jgi:hypothetical protein
MSTIEKADRIKNLPPYLFAKIDQMKAEMQQKGKDIIDLGIGDPDLPTPPHIITALQDAANDPKNHRYPSYSGMLEFSWTLVLKPFLSLVLKRVLPTFLWLTLTPKILFSFPNRGTPSTARPPCLLVVIPILCHCLKKKISCLISLQSPKKFSRRQS